MDLQFPDVIIHNSTSLDGSLTGFLPNMQLHYQLAGNFRPQVHLVGSNTMKTGIEMFEEEIPAEEEEDFVQPERDDSLPYWVIIDTMGSLQGYLHINRRFEFCRDVIIMLSEKSPSDYIDHLKERNYRHHVLGEEHVDLLRMFDVLTTEYDTQTVLTDTGKTLGNILLRGGFVKQLSLLIHPVIVGKSGDNMFGELNLMSNLDLMSSEILEEKYIWSQYEFVK